MKNIENGVFFNVKLFIEKVLIKPKRTFSIKQMNVLETKDR